MCSPTVPGRTPGRLHTVGRITRDPQRGGVLQRPLTSQDVPVLIHCLLGIVAFALDRDQPLAHLPLITGPRASATGLVGIPLSLCAAPCTEGLRGPDDSTFTHERLDIA